MAQEQTDNVEAKNLVLSHRRGDTPWKLLTIEIYRRRLTPNLEFRAHKQTCRASGQDLKWVLGESDSFTRGKSALWLPCRRKDRVRLYLEHETRIF